MDFLKTLDARTAAETPRELHLRHPATGEPIFDGELPCIVLVKGASSRTVQAAIREDEMAAMKGGEKPDAQSLEDMHNRSVKAATRLIAGFVGMETEGRAMTLDDAPKFLDLTLISVQHLMRKPGDGEWHRPSFAQQILDFAHDDANFLPAMSKG